MFTNKISIWFLTRHWLTTALLVVSFFSFNLHANSDNSLYKLPSLNNEHQVIVKFKAAKNFTPLQAQQKLSVMSRELNTQLQFERQLGSGAQLINFDAAANKDRLVNQLQQRKDVKYAVPNYRLYPLATPTDPRYNEQWHYYEAAGGINGPAAWDLSEGEGVTVAVVDTGYRPHVDLAENIVGGYDFISDSGTARDGDGRDNDASDEGDWFGFFECPGALFNSMNSSWHGTHVAGTIAAVNNNDEGVAGIATKAKVVPVRVLGKCGGTLADIQEGMLWAAGLSVSGIPDNSNPAQVINLSLGGGAACDAAMQDAVNQITAAGTLVVAAAGNSNADASDFTPASCDNVLTIASVNRNGGKASYSNFGSVVEVAAPGGETSGGAANGILSTLNTGTQGPENDSYAFYQGTSMAAPHAAGVAALLYSANPSATPAEVTQVLVDTARSFPASCNQCGRGIIDAHAAVLAIGEGENQLPQASFNYSTTGLYVTFTDTSFDPDGSISSWSWNFDDGNTSAEQNPAHEYLEPGTYNVTLIVTDNQGATDTQSVAITVNYGDENLPPEAAFSFSASDLSVAFTDQSTDDDGTVSSWSWDFGDGNSSSEQNPTHDYDAAGSYTVTLTVTDDLGATNSTSQQVTVTATPVEEITLNASVSSFWFFHTISLNWENAPGDQVDIYRNGSLLTTTANDGNWSETRYFSGSGTYQVCEAGTDNCSNEASVNY